MGLYATLIVLIMGLFVLPVLPASTTHAQSAGDVSYEGTQEAGGPIRLVVSADGARIVLFEAEGVAGGGCSWDTITLANWGSDVAVVDGRFAATNMDGDVLDGSMLPAPGSPARIEGTIKVHDPVKGCETPPLRWIADPVRP